MCKRIGSKNIIRVFAALATVLISFCSFSMTSLWANENYNGFLYSVADNGVVIEGVDSTLSQASEIEIPSQIEGKDVVQIASKAFLNCKTIEKITLPDTISKIGFRAFSGCSGLSSIVLPENEPEMMVDSLDVHGKVFSGCTSLKEVSIPESWNHIPDLMLAESEIEKIDLGASVSMNEISANSFSGCKKLKTVIFPANITRICRMAFANCESLKTITIPDTVDEIGYMAFGGCIQLEKVCLPQSAPKMIREVLDTHGRVFSGCTALSDIEIPQGWKVIPDSMFQACGITSVSIPKDVKTIEAKAFSQCEGLEAIEMNEESQVAEDAFEKISKQAKVTVRRKAPSITTFIEKDFNMNYRGEYTYPEGVLESTGNSFSINRSRISAGMSCSFILNYSVAESDFQELSQTKVTVYIPTSMNYADVDGAVYVNGKKAEAGQLQYDTKTRRLTVPVTGASGTIRISLVAQGNGSVQSYAALSYERNGILKSQIIDVLKVSVPTLSLECATRVQSSSLYVYGITDPGAEVLLYCESELAGTVKANQLGEYNASLSLPGEGTYKISAQCADNPDIQASKYVIYDAKNIALTKFEFYYHNHNVGWTFADLLSGNGKLIVSINPYEKVLFKLKFSDSTDIQEVYVVSTKNGVKKYLEAVKTESGEYVASGFFDKKNPADAFGQLSVKYYLKDNASATTGEDDEPDECVQETKREQMRDFIDEATDGEYDFRTVSLTNVKKAEGVSEDGSLRTEITGDLNFKSGRTIHAEVIRRVLSSQESLKLRKEISENKDGEYHVRYVRGRWCATKSNPSKGKMTWISETDDLENGGLVVFDMLVEGAETIGEFCPVFDMVADYLKHFRIALTDGDESDHMKLIFEEVASFIFDEFFDACDEGVQAFKDFAYAMYEFILGEDGIIQKIIEFIFDPSGYVYEAVEENRLENVKTSIYYKEKLSDSEGVLWEATEYGQENPLYTDRYGEYAWDVPEGFWQVRYEKDGYETEYSEWMKVPPVRTGVNIGMTSKSLPEVEQVYTDGKIMTIIFSQYMKVSSLSGISVKGTGNTNYSYTISEKDLAKNVTLEFDKDFSTGVPSVQIAVPATASNYADKSMKSSFEGTVFVKKLPSFDVADSVKLSFGGSESVEFSVNNYSTSDEVEASVSDEVGLILEPLSVDDSGHGILSVHGKLPGNYTVTLRINGTAISKEIGVLVGEVGDNQEDDPENTWLEMVEKPSENTYIVNIATGQRLVISDLSKTRADGRNYRITETKSEKAIATLSLKGVIRAKKAGTAEITLEKSGVTYTIKVNVVKPQFVYAGRAKYYTTNVGERIIPSYDNCRLRPTFSIPKRQQKYATVDPLTGEVTAIAKGVVTVSATVGEGKLSRRVTTKVRIYNPVIKVGKGEVKVGKTLKASISGGVKSTQWSIVNGTGEATIDEKGRIRGIRAGTVTVKAINNGKTLEKKITVLDDVK